MRIAPQPSVTGPGFLLRAFVAPSLIRSLFMCVSPKPPRQARKQLRMADIQRLSAARAVRRSNPDRADRAPVLIGLRAVRTRIGALGEFTKFVGGIDCRSLAVAPARRCRQS